VQKIFIIGPFFTKAEEMFMLKVKERLAKDGKEVKTPLDIGYVKDGSEKLFNEDLRTIEQSKIVVAILDGHDPGTMCEVGYAKSAGKKIIGLWTDKERRVDPFVKWLCTKIVNSLDELLEVYITIIGDGESKI
jgi:nucleoside 2-deoxyribosyltransferase